MATFAIPSTSLDVAGNIARDHLGKNIDGLRAALTERLKYDPLETIRDEQHETRLLATGALLVVADDTTGRILVVG
jgi:hypothetical protein